MTKGYDIIWLDKVDSTNEYVKKHIKELDNLSVVSAREQTGGKGQGDHDWHSEPEKNLTFSIAHVVLELGEQGYCSCHGHILEVVLLPVLS